MLTSCRRFPTPDGGIGLPVRECSDGLAFNEEKRVENLTEGDIQLDRAHIHAADAVYVRNVTLVFIRPVSYPDPRRSDHLPRPDCSKS